MKLLWISLFLAGISALQIFQSNDLEGEFNTCISSQQSQRFDDSKALLTDLLPAEGEPVIEWLTETEYEFGDLPQKKEATAIFKFKNITDEPMTIDAVRVSCGCTAPDWSLVPIEPDSVGVINIVYDAEKAGYFRKKVRVFVSAQRWSEKIYVSGFVE